MNIFFYGICINNKPSFFKRITPFVLSLKFVSGGYVIIHFCHEDKRYQVECFGELKYLNICNSLDDSRVIESFLDKETFCLLE